MILLASAECANNKQWLSPISNTSMTHFFPQTRLGFRDNPFRALTDAEWAALAVLPDDLHRLADDSTTHLQLTGPKGRGKSTALRGLAHHLRQRGQVVHFEYIPPGQRHFKTQMPNAAAVFVLDEMQRLNWLSRAWLLTALHRRPLRLIFSTHPDLSGWFRLWRLPLASYPVEEQPPGTLDAILARRLDYFRLPAQPETPVHFTTGAVAHLEARFGTDRRAMVIFLYEVFQHMTDPQPITADWLAAQPAPIPHQARQKDRPRRGRSHP